MPKVRGFEGCATLPGTDYAPWDSGESMTIAPGSCARALIDSRAARRFLAEDLVRFRAQCLEIALDLAQRVADFDSPAVVPLGQQAVPEPVMAQREEELVVRPLGFGALPARLQEVLHRFI